MLNDVSQTTYKCVQPRWHLSYLPPHLIRLQIRLAAIHEHRNAVSSYLTEYELAGIPAALDGASSSLWLQACNNVSIRRIETLVKLMILAELVL